MTIKRRAYGSENKDHLKFWFVLERIVKGIHSLEKKAEALRMVSVFEIVESQGSRERST